MQDASVIQERPNMLIIHYDSFAEYSQILKASGSQYKAHFTYAKDKEKVPKY